MSEKGMGSSMESGIFIPIYLCGVPDKSVYDNSDDDMPQHCECHNNL